MTNVLKKYKITYFMYPYENIEFTILAKDYDEAVLFAKNYRKESFNVVFVDEVSY